MPAIINNVFANFFQQNISFIRSYKVILITNESDIYSQFHTIYLVYLMSKATHTETRHFCHNRAHSKIKRMAVNEFLYFFLLSQYVGHANSEACVMLQFVRGRTEQRSVTRSHLPVIL